MATFKTKTSSVLTFALVLLLAACSSTAEKKQKKQAEIYYGAGTQSLLTKDYTDALTNLLKANQLDPQNPGILNNLGMAYYFKGEKDLAIKTLKKCLALDEKNSDAKINLASIHFHTGDLSAAEKIYKTVLKDLTYDKQARTFYNLAIIEIKRKNNLQAEQYLKKSTAEDPNYCAAHFQLGLLNYNHGKYSSALKNFKDGSMGTCFENPAAHFYQAMSYTKLKLFTEARIKYDEIDARFKSSAYAVKARTNLLELNELEKNFSTSETQASRKMLESPEF
jgi:type IV pilus assembly protein PilF